MESPSHSVSPQSASSPVAFISSPLGIALLMLVSSVLGNWIKDRLSLETGGTTSTVRIEALDQRLGKLETASLPAAQFQEYQKATDQRLDEIRDLVREINHNLSLYGPPPARR